MPLLINVVGGVLPHLVLVQALCCESLAMPQLYAQGWTTPMLPGTPGVTTKEIDGALVLWTDVLGKKTQKNGTGTGLPR